MLFFIAPCYIISMSIITLTTDFGWSDYFVGAIKGVICQISPEAKIVDITHDIPTHDILAGALVLKEAWRSFPPNTIHIGVVDPGVGTNRRIILAQYSNQLFVVPDNGLITMIHHIAMPSQVNLVSNRSLFCQPISPTFHGRDIIAPVAANLSKGVSPDEVGPRIDILKLLEVPYPQRGDGTLRGQIIHIDRFGNLMTNITTDDLLSLGEAMNTLSVRFKDGLIGSVRDTFGNVQPNQPLAYMGSAGFLEIAINQSRADTILQGRLNDAVEVLCPGR